MRSAAIALLLALAGCSGPLCEPTGQTYYRQTFAGFTSMPVREMKCADGTMQYWRVW